MVSCKDGEAAIFENMAMEPDAARGHMSRSKPGTGFSDRGMGNPSLVMRRLALVSVEAQRREPWDRRGETRGGLGAVGFDVLNGVGWGGDACR